MVQLRVVSFPALFSSATGSAGDVFPEACVADALAPFHRICEIAVLLC
jgi:hypothetical protein